MILSLLKNLFYFIIVVCLFLSNSIGFRWRTQTHKLSSVLFRVGTVTDDSIVLFNLRGDEVLKFDCVYKEF